MAELQFYRDAKASNECHCGRVKKKGHPFCWHCWNKLPGELQRGLYSHLDTKTWGEGYEEAVEYLSE